MSAGCDEVMASSERVQMKAGTGFTVLSAHPFCDTLATIDILAHCYHVGYGCGLGLESDGYFHRESVLSCCDYKLKSIRYGVRDVEVPE